MTPPDKKRDGTMAYGHEDETNSSELGKELCVNENISIS
jgi:hypothetical protein